jgi:glycosyltransferase involved in cell wall biosynthesis
MGARRAALINFPYCVDTEGFTPADRVNAGLIVFGTCARLAHLKGIDLALRAVASLPPDLRARTRYRIAGGEELEASLRGDAERLGIAGQVDFKGWVRQEELPDFYGSLDAYVHPARFEPYGVAVIEALACGLPVLASDATTSALDRMADGKSGFLHRAGDETDLARTMRIFSELPFRRREEMGRAARRSALSWTPREARRTIERLVTSVHSGGCAASSALLEFHQ